MKNIEYISDLFYKKCFSYNRLCVLKTLKKDYKCLLANDRFYYSTLSINGKNVPCLKIESVYDENSIMQKMGIKVQMNTWNGNADFINQFLNNDCLVLQTIDNFYFPKHSWLFNKSHSLHGFLIYDYDASRQTYGILDPWGFHTSTPLLIEVSVEDMCGAITKSCQSIPGEIVSTAYCLDEAEVSADLSFSNDYENFFKKNYDQQLICDGLALFKDSMSEYIRNIYVNYSDFYSQDEYKLTFRRLIEKRKSYSYCLSQIFADDVLNQLSEAVEKRFVSLTSLGLDMFKKKRGANFIQNSFDLVNEVAELEKQINLRITKKL